MSEFSESYHLRNTTADEAVAVLKRGRLAGFVFPPEKGWTTILPSGQIYEPNDRLIGSNIGTLLRYWYAEDHGWGFTLFQGNRKVVAYECEWDGDDMEIDDSKAVGVDALIAALKTGVPKYDADLERALREFFFPADEDDLFDDRAYQFARIIGLTNYEWLSFQYVHKDLNSPHGPGNYEHLIRVTV